MNFFGLFGNTPAEKAQKLRTKATQRYGDPAVRQKAITALGDLQGTEAIEALLARLAVNVEPQTTDADEKEQVFDLICARGEAAVEPTRQFLLRSDQASSWAVRILDALLSKETVAGMLCEALVRLGAEYTRDSEKKVVLLKALRERLQREMVAPLLPLLGDLSDEVKIAAIEILCQGAGDAARDEILRIVVAGDTAKRVRMAGIAALHECKLGVQGYREQVEALLTDPWYVDRSGLLRKRGEPLAAT